MLSWPERNKTVSRTAGTDPAVAADHVAGNHAAIHAGGQSMSWILTKYFVTAAVVVAVSEVAKRSDKLGALIAALPLVTVLALIWLYVEQQPQEKIANHAWYTFWYVLPTLPMFLVFPALLPRIGFWPTLLACVVMTVVLFAGFGVVMRRFGVELL